jgi:hypothetical protein
MNIFQSCEFHPAIKIKLYTDETQMPFVFRFTLPFVCLQRREGRAEFGSHAK